MSDRHFAIGIDGRDWSEELHALSFTRSTTVRTERTNGSPRLTPGRHTASMTLTMRRTEEAQALVGTIPEDGKAEVLLMLASTPPADERPIVIAYRFDATTLLPPWDTTVEISGVAYFESAWFAERVSSCQLRVPGNAA